MPLTVWAALAASLTLAADAKHVCVAASDAAQDARAHGRLRTAREQLLVCTQQVCPPPVRRTCEDWLRKLETQLPSVVLRLTDPEGHDVMDAQVWLDGQPLAEGLSGRAFALDPGVHVFRFESREHALVEQRVLILEAEQNRVLTQVLPTLTTAPVVPAASPPRLSEAAETSAPASVALTPDAARSGPGPAPWVLAGTAVVGLGAFAYLAIAGSNDYQGCVQTPCAPGARNSLNTERALAWTALGVGVVSAGAAAWLLWKERPRVAGAVSPLPGGGAVAGLSTRF
jgi:hypothetical protein